MSQVAIEITTPIGRIVQGDLFKQQQKRDNNQQPKTKADGTPDMQYYFGLAIEKTHPELGAFWQQLEAVARQGFPHFFPPNGTGQCVKPDFAWKMIDGDSYDAQGKPYAEREGFKGCYVFRFSTEFPIRVYYPGRYADADIVKNPALCPRGYYIRARISVKPNNSTQTPGLYLNPLMVEIAGQGEAITSGPDAGAAFGSAPAAAGYVPQGMQALNIPANPGAMGGMPGQPGQPAPMMGGMPGAMPGQPAPMAALQPPAAAQPGFAMPAGVQGVAPQGAPAAMPGSMAMGAPGMMPGAGVPMGAAPGFAPPPGVAAGAAMPGAGAAMPGMPAAGMPPGVAPNHGFVAGAIGGMPTPPATPQPILVPGPNSQGHALDAWRAAGYNDQQMLQQGIAVMQ